MVKVRIIWVAVHFTPGDRNTKCHKETRPYAVGSTSEVDGGTTPPSNSRPAIIDAIFSDHFAVRRLFYILLLICLPLQSFASQIAGLQSSVLAGVAHESEHAEELHHHGDDGAIHYDDSDESVAHADEHSALAQLSLLHPADMLFGVLPVSLVDYPDPASCKPNPCLDDPQRPPSFAPGLAAGG